MCPESLYQLLPNPRPSQLSYLPPWLVKGLKMEGSEPGRKMEHLWRNRLRCGGPWTWSLWSGTLALGTLAELPQWPQALHHIRPSTWAAFLVHALLLGRITEIKTNPNDSFGKLSLNKCGLWKSSCFYTLVEGCVECW